MQVVQEAIATEHLLKQMEDGRGSIYPAHRFVAERDPGFPAGL
jgi:hypothetical protein